MSFRQMREARASRHPKSFVVPHINDVRAWRATIESPVTSTQSDQQGTEEQLIWTTASEEKTDDGEEEELEVSEELENRFADGQAPRLVNGENALQRASLEDHTMQGSSVNKASIPAAIDIRTETSTSTSKQNAIMISTNDERAPSLHSTPVSSNGWYSYLPSHLVIRRSEKRGRGLWTKEAIRSGTVLFTVKPHSYVLSRAQLNAFCSACCAPRPSSGLKRCPKCKIVCYCNSTCQIADWSMHKSECEALHRWAESASGTSTGEIEDELRSGVIAPEAIRCLARIMWKRKKEGSPSIWWKEINEMQTHRDNIAPSTIDTHVHLAHGLVRYMGIDGPAALAKYEVQGVGELVDLISKFTSNSFTLTTPTLSPIGVSVSPLPALVNHSCDPNVAIVFPRAASSSTSPQEPSLHVVAIQDIDPNTELLTSYIDTTLPTTQRQKDLKETYNFVCECSICSPAKDTAVADWRERLWCPKDCGGTCTISSTYDDLSVCSDCDAQLKDAENLVGAVRVGQEALDKATSLQFADPAQALKLTRNIIPLLVAARLTPSAHPLLALYRLNTSLLIETLFESEPSSQDVLDETIRSAAKAAAGLSNILHEGHPVRAVSLAELGKLLAVDEPSSSASTGANSSTSGFSTSNAIFPPSGPARLKLALQTLKQALAELQIGFGRANGGGVAGKEVREMVLSLEKELGVWNKGLGETLADTIAEQRGANVRR